MALTDNLISFWRQDETGTGNRADSKGSNTLTNNGSLTNGAGLQRISPGSAVDAAYVSASAQFLSVADNAGFAFGANFSLSAWVKFGNYTTDPNQVVAAKWDYQTQGEWVLQMCNGTNDIRGFIATTITDDGGSNFVTWSGALPTAGTWCHLVMVYDGSLAAGSRLKLYINGSLATATVTGTIPATMPHGSADFKLGKFGGTLTRYLNGAQQDTGLWSRSLTSTEAATLYNGGTPPYFDGANFVTTSTTTSTSTSTTTTSTSTSTSTTTTSTSTSTTTTSTSTSTSTTTTSTSTSTTITTSTSTITTSTSTTTISTSTTTISTSTTTSTSTSTTTTFSYSADIDNADLPLSLNMEITDKSQDLNLSIERKTEQV